MTRKTQVLDAPWVANSRVIVPFIGSQRWLMIELEPLCVQIALGLALAV
jgi:hypothetical protein